MRLAFYGLFRRARQFSFVAAVALLPAPAFALLPWNGDGGCNALLAPGWRAQECDFRDYLDPGMPGPSDVIGASAPDAVAEDVVVLPPPPSEAVGQASTATTPYDWSATATCGPTDWDCGWYDAYEQAPPSPLPVAEAFQAVGRILPSPWSMLPGWDSAAEAFQSLKSSRFNVGRRSEQARRGAGVALQVTVRVAAMRLSGTLDMVGRQMLSVSDVLEGVAAQGDTPVAKTASRPAGPQPAKDPYSHLGL